MLIQAGIASLAFGARNKIILLIIRMLLKNIWVIMMYMIMQQIILECGLEVLKLQQRIGK